MVINGYVRRNVVVLQQIAKDVAEKAIRPTRVERLLESPACVVDTDLVKCSLGTGSLRVQEEREGGSATHQCVAIIVGHTDHVDVLDEAVALRLPALPQRGRQATIAIAALVPNANVAPRCGRPDSCKTVNSWD